MQANFTSSQKIKSFRRQLGLSQQEFADQLGVSRSYLGDIESGRSQPSRHFLTSMKAKFDVKTDWILGEVNDGQAVYRAEIEEDRIDLIQRWIEQVRKGGIKERHWFEIQFQRAFPDFTQWLQDRSK